MSWDAIIERTFEVTGKSGDEFVCKCPWHDDQGKPNLYINGYKGVFLCHACGAKGHLRSLGETPLVEVSTLREKLHRLQTPPLKIKYYSEAWLAQFAFDHPYWSTRGLSPEIVKQFGLGFDPVDNVLTIPLKDDKGRVRGVIKRRLDNEKPKYLYPSGVKIGQILFGADLVRKSKFRKVALVEGSLDAIACWDSRIPALGLLGARITHDQRLLLQSLNIHTVVTMTDNDNAGREAAAQIKESLRGIHVLEGVYRPYWTAKDPADLKPQQRRKLYHSAGIVPR
jgi:5S rRNA maturation endonuclease (ribonuclease M5)